MNHLKNTNRAATVWTAGLAFAFPFLSLVTLVGVSLSSFLFLLGAVVRYRDCRAALARHWQQCRWVVYAFLFNFGLTLVYYLARPDSSANHLEKPLRMLLAVSALALALATRIPRRALWWGVIAGALAALPLVAWQRLALGMDRPGGLINPITFGDLALCLALVAVAASADFHGPRRAAWPALGALAWLAASLLTGTRGGFVALLLAAPLLARRAGRRMRALLLALAALLALAWFVPALGVQARLAEGVADARTWYAGGNVNTNVGTRLELWKGAAALVAEHPLLGIDQNAIAPALARLARQGRLDPVVLPLPHLHNDALQALVTGGLPGVLAWLGLLAAPGAFFTRRMSGAAAAPALAGLLVVLCYFSFGLTEVIFWSVKGCLFYALMVFLLMGLCLNAKEEIEI
jgi:O-antigen ligase